MWVSTLRTSTATKCWSPHSSTLWAPSCYAPTTVVTSTDILDVICREGVQVVLRAIRKSRCVNYRERQLATGIVCCETGVCQAFTNEKRAVLETFNSMMPLPGRELSLLHNKLPLKTSMVSLRNVLITFVASALALKEFTAAAPCGEVDYSTVESAVQSLNVNCASWAAHLASGGVWHCDSTCYQSVAKLVGTLPDCEFGALNGQNYREVVEGLIMNCEAELLTSSGSTDESTTPASSEEQQRFLHSTPLRPTSGGTTSTTSSADKPLGSAVVQLAAVVWGMTVVILQ